MGTSAARITAQDFLTPPELADRALASNSAGRIGGVRLELRDDARGTCLGESYQQIPLQVLPPFRFGAQRPSLLYLLNPTAGLMDGDAQLVHLVARSGSRAVVTGQSATRIHPSWRGFCTQQWDVSIEPGAIVVVLPGPAIPFQGCRYYQRVSIHLDEGAGLIWGDLWFAGRYARGADSEQFQFETIIQDFTVKRKGRLVFRDRFCWRGPWKDETAAWHFGMRKGGMSPPPPQLGEERVGSLGGVSDADGDMAATFGSPHFASGSLFATGSVDESWLPPGDDLEWGLFPTAAQDTCIRFLGSSEKVTKALVNTALQVAAVRAGNSAHEPWLLPSHDLAPNHWFHAGDIER